jgi:hypothetical protein
MTSIKQTVSDEMSGLENQLNLHQLKMNSSGHQLFASSLPDMGGSSSVASLRGSPVTSLRIAANRPAVPLPTGGQNVVRVSADHVMVPAGRSLSANGPSGLSGVHAAATVGSHQSKSASAAMGDLGQQQHVAATNHRYQELISQRILNSQTLCLASNAGDFTSGSVAAGVPKSARSVSAMQPVSGGYRSAVGAVGSGLVQTLPRHQQQQQLHQDFSNQECCPSDYHFCVKELF